jgi:hypothetical protein
MLNLDVGQIEQSYLRFAGFCRVVLSERIENRLRYSFVAFRSNGGRTK